jgi:hypothetical protein
LTTQELTEGAYIIWRKSGVAADHQDSDACEAAIQEWLAFSIDFSEAWLKGYLEGMARDVAPLLAVTPGSVFASREYEQGYDIGREVRRRLIREGLMKNLKADETTFQ